MVIENIYLFGILIPMEIVSEELLAETEPPKILPRILTRFDLVAIYFAIIFGAYGAAQLAASGWAGIPMLFLAMVTFLLPCGLAAYELGTLFPSEGGVYVWAHKAFGPLHGFIAGWLSWMPIFLLIPLDTTIIVSFIQYIFGVSWSMPVQILVQILIVWILLSLAVLRLRISQTVVNIMFFGAILTAIAALVAGLLHSPAATPINSDIFSFDLGKYGFLYSAAVLWLLGVEIPFNMSAEFSDHKRTGKTMLIWGTLALFLGYIMGIVGILLTTSVAQIDQTTGIAKAVATISPLAGIIVAVVISFAVFAQSISTMNAYSRLPFIGGIEKKLPNGLSKVSKKNKSPWPAMLVQAVGASIVILIFATQTQLVVTYNLYLAALVAIWCASLFYIYFGLLRVRNTHHELYARRKDDIWRIPGGRFGLWFCCGVGIIFNTLAIYYVFAKPWIGGISENNWNAWLGASCIFIVITGFLVYFAGKKFIKHS
jgi:glutamate:GABA antiporter